ERRGLEDRRVRGRPDEGGLRLRRLVPDRPGVVQGRDPQPAQVRRAARLERQVLAHRQGGVDARIHPEITDTSSTFVASSVSLPGLTRSAAATAPPALVDTTFSVEATS